MALPRKNRLTRKKDFDLVFKKGNAVRGSFLFIKAADNNSLVSRFAIIIPAKLVSGAVARNRIKRLLAGVIQKNSDKWPTGQDMAVVLSKKGDESLLGCELLELLTKNKR